jgi:hypothetical protein
VFDESTLLYIIYKQIGTFLRGVFTNESNLLFAHQIKPLLETQVVDYGGHEGFLRK